MANGIPQILVRVITSMRKTRTSLEESQDGSILQNQNATNVAHLGIMQINTQSQQIQENKPVPLE